MSVNQPKKPHAGGHFVCDLFIWSWRYQPGRIVVSQPAFEEKVAFMLFTIFNLSV